MKSEVTAIDIHERDISNGDAAEKIYDALLNDEELDEACITNTGHKKSHLKVGCLELPTKCIWITGKA